MSSSTMPPPPSPLAHRRTTSPSCGLRKMSLSKAETFHHSSSTPTIDDPVLSVAHLSKRSTTHTSSSFASWLYNSREAASDVIADFEQTFSGARGPRSATRRRSAQDFEDNLLTKASLRASSPVDSGIGSSVGSPSEKNLTRFLSRALDLTSNKDSALGDSLSGSGSIAGVGDSIIKATNSNKVSTTTRSSSSRTSGQALTIIRYPIPTYKKNSQPLLSSLARRQIYKRLFAPLLQEERFEEFRPIVAGTRKNKNLRCLRDIEQSLINQPVTLSVTAAEYRAFGELTVQLVVDTFQHLSESEQRRSTDRAYDNGYFLDLVQQVQQLAAHIGSSDTTVEDGSAPTLDDEITLEGGIGDTGDFAELVRWKNGEGISLRTGLPYIGMPASLKRGASGQLAEDAERSARRKKGYIPEIVNLPCSQKDCDKIFHRKCDLSKHEKTHTRPYKCPVPGCKYHELGLPTEKELDRHMNDKHEDAPALYTCDWEGCGFKSKRESNLKQHKEKKHGWTYIRQKGTHKGTGMAVTPAQSANTPSVGYSSVQPSPAPLHMNTWDNNNASMPGSVNQSPYEQLQNDFEYSHPYSNPLFPRTQTAPQAEFNFNAPIQNAYKPGNDGINTAPYPTPQSGVLNSFSPTTPAYSNITGSPMLTDTNPYTQHFQGYNQMPTPGSRRVSYNQMPAQNFGMVDNMVNNVSFDNGVPNTDFNLFTSENDNAFTHVGAGDATLFHNDHFMPEYTPDQFDLPDMDIGQFTNAMDEDQEFKNIDEMFNFN